MKLTIENVQVAIKGVAKYSGICISEKLLAVVAGNYAKGNNIILLRLQSLYEDENFDSTVGEIKNLYYSEANGQPQLRGDIIFDTELLDLQSLLHSLAHGYVYLSPYFMNVGSSNYCFACLSSVTLSKVEAATFDGIEPLDISCLNVLINTLYKEQVTEDTAKYTTSPIAYTSSPYIHAGNMSKDDLRIWLNNVVEHIGIEQKCLSRLESINSNKANAESDLKQCRNFLGEVFRSTETGRF
ncbi:hypothetical protein DLR11_12410 [Salmonella enterica subsp. salamae]|uniref:Uncharacterized protein n=1 Tax=Salmonella enterica subsp. salamae TaxID=59202 RepID=A0A5Y3UYZ9_SALER|nr:hypothetical protein [Salmonella enterica subsp. salamae]ECI3452618.1 hypothetical protein [Salmonella enterica subsp. salamae]ECJ2326751.1 hypothetical protein [Salmonella enterica subsp. salamae]EEO8343773.1 hypothetical protein [Salmonella enterica]